MVNECGIWSSTKYFSKPSTKFFKSLPSRVCFRQFFQNLFGRQDLIMDDERGVWNKTKNLFKPLSLFFLLLLSGYMFHTRSHDMPLLQNYDRFDFSLRLPKVMCRFTTFVELLRLLTYCASHQYVKFYQIQDAGKSMHKILFYGLSAKLMNYNFI